MRTVHCLNKECVLEPMKGDGSKTSMASQWSESDESLAELQRGNGMGVEEEITPIPFKAKVTIKRKSLKKQTGKGRARKTKLNSTNRTIKRKGPKKSKKPKSKGKKK